MNLNALRAFIAIMQHGTLTKAAEHIHRTQPTTSRLIAALEAQLDIKLFEREKQRLIATPAAEAFYAEATRIISTLDEVPHILDEIRESNAHRIRFVTLPRLAHAIVSPAISQMLEKDTKTRISVDIRSIRDLERWVAGQHYDLALTSLPVIHKAVKTVPLFSAPLVAMLPNSHPLVGETEIEIQALANIPLVALPKGTLLRNHLDYLTDCAGFKARVAVEASTSMLALKLAADGAGIAVVDGIVPFDMIARKLTAVPIHPASRMNYGLMWSKAAPPSGDTENLLHAIIQQVNLYGQQALGILGFDPQIKIDTAQVLERFSQEVQDSED